MVLSRIKPMVTFIISNVTIEPIVFLFSFTWSVYFPIYNKMFADRLCARSYSADVCAHLAQNPDADAIVRAEWAQWASYLVATRTVPGSFFSLFVATWSDAHGGRKPLMYMCPIGMIIATILLLINTYIPTLPLWQLLIPEFILYLTGGIIAMQTVSTAYISDIAPLDSRSPRLGVMVGCSSAGSAVSGFLGSYLVSLHDEAVVFMIVMGVSAAIVLYTWFLVRETHFPKRDEGELVPSGPARLVRIFRMENLVHMYRMLTRPRPYRSQLQLWLFGFTIYFLFTSDGLLYQPYIQHAPMHWTLSWMMFVDSIGSIWYVIFFLLLFPPIKRALLAADFLATDELVAFVGSGMWIFNSYIYSVARSNWLIYLTKMIGPGDNASVMAIQSLLSAFVEHNELCTLFAVMSLISKIVHVPAAFVYAWLFKVTAPISPSFIWVVPATLTLIPFALFGYLYCGVRKRVLRERAAESAK